MYKYLKFTRVRLVHYYKSLLKSFYENSRSKSIKKEWLEKGSVLPAPYIIKYDYVSEIQQKYNFENFVESGTFIGGMINYQKKNFKKLYSIELNEFLFKKAKNRFKRVPNVKIIQGDSGEVLADLLQKVDGTILFWLDGHYSAGITSLGDEVSPIFNELNAIFDSDIDLSTSMILIDDARLFTGKDGYPSISQLEEKVISHDSTLICEVEGDVFRIAK